MKIPKGFKGLVYKPSNEQETIALFLLLMPKIKPSWCIYRMQKDFPDAIFYDTRQKKEIRVEFEYLASSFNHNKEGCDMIICWEKDLSDADIRRLNLQILSLKDIVLNNHWKDVYRGESKREGSPDEKLEESIKQKDRVACSVGMLVNNVIPRLEKKYSELFLDRNRTAHYVLRWKGEGMFGVYPSGNLVAENVDMYVRKFGKKARKPGSEFRHIVKNEVGGLHVAQKVTNTELKRKVNVLERALSRFCERLDRL